MVKALPVERGYAWKQGHLGEIACDAISTLMEENSLPRPISMAQLREKMKELLPKDFVLTSLEVVNVFRKNTELKQRFTLDNSRAEEYVMPLTTEIRFALMLCMSGGRKRDRRRHTPALRTRINPFRKMAAW